MAKKIWINKSRSFAEAARFDEAYYARMTRREKMETMGFLRETGYKIRKVDPNGRRKRLRRFYKIIEQT